ncbi:MAG: DUF1679 domain-containing protein [Firmicutes bacterium]|nr:DUF1679 domain-containing protein [Bacillota bacterium]
MTNLENVKNIIKSSYPKFKIENIILGHKGQNNNIFIINNEYIFRFPKFKNGIDNIFREDKLLESINNYISIDIPKYKFKSLENKRVGEDFVGYKKIGGEPLYKNIFKEIDNISVLAKDLSIFLKELHSVPINKLPIEIEVVNNYKYWLDMYMKIREKLYVYMKEETWKKIEKQFDEFFKDNSNFQYKPTLVHGDFGPSNILFDKDKERVIGVIDFSESKIHDPAIDIASLIGPFGYGEDFILKLRKLYPQVDSYIKRAKFYASTFPIQEALFGLENNDEKAFNNGMVMIS